MAEGKLDHLTDAGHLSCATTNIIITNTIGGFFIFTLDWLSFGVNHGFISDSTEVAWSNLDNLKFNRSKVTTYSEAISLVNWAESITEIRNDVSLSQITSKALNGVSKRQNFNLLGIWQFWNSRDNYNISESYT